MSWKSAVKDSGQGFYTLQTEDTGAVPVRLFLTPNLLDQVEESIYPQIVNAASFPGVKLVAITPTSTTATACPSAPDSSPMLTPVPWPWAPWASIFAAG